MRVDHGGSEKLPYLNVCVQEALRWDPPAVPIELSRAAPAGRSTICGEHAPANLRYTVVFDTSSVHGLCGGQCSKACFRQFETGLGVVLAVTQEDFVY